MADIRDPRIIYVKGFLFLISGLLASALLILEQPTLKVGFLLVVAVWCFARFYYIAFYVIEHYVDPSYRFAGLVSFLCYLLKRQKGPIKEETLNRPVNPENEETH